MDVLGDELRVELLLCVRDLVVPDRIGMLTVRVLDVRPDEPIFEPMELLERVVVCLLIVEFLVLRDPAEDGLRTIVVPTDRWLLTEPLVEMPEDIFGREIVVRPVVLRVEFRLDILLLEFLLDAIELERLVVELRVDVLGVLLRVEILGALDRLGVLVVRFDEFELLVPEVRDRELELAALRLLLLPLPELPLFRELLAAKTGSIVNAKMKTQNAKINEVIPARRDSSILIFDF